MRIVSVAALVAAVALLSPTVLRAQSLGEVASKEKEKRKTQKAGKVYTEDDLRRAGGRGASFPEGSATAETAPAAAEAKPQGEGEAAAPKVDEQQRAEQEKAWRERLKKANDDVARLTTQIGQLETALADPTKGIYTQSRTNTTNQLAEAKKLLATAKETVASLEQEGRKNGYK